MSWSLDDRRDKVSTLDSRLFGIPFSYFHRLSLFVSSVSFLKYLRHLEKNIGSKLETTPGQHYDGMEGVSCRNN